MSKRHKMIRCRKCGRLMPEKRYETHAASCKGPPVCFTALYDIKSGTISDKAIQLKAMIIAYESFDIDDVVLKAPEGIEIERMIPEDPPEKLTAGAKYRLLFLLKVKEPGDYVIGPMEVQAKLRDGLVQTVSSKRVRADFTPVEPDLVIRPEIPDNLSTLVPTPIRLHYENTGTRPIQMIMTKLRPSRCSLGPLKRIDKLKPGEAMTLDTHLTPEIPGSRVIHFDSKIAYTQTRKLSFSTPAEIDVHTKDPVLKIETSLQEVDKELGRFHYRVWVTNVGEGPATEVRLEVTLSEDVTVLLAGMVWSHHEIILPGKSTEPLDIWAQPREGRDKSIRIKGIIASYLNADKESPKVTMAGPFEFYPED